MWSGSITLGLFNIPVSVGKAWGDSWQKNAGIRDICTCHKLPIDRSERCEKTGQDATGKEKGVEIKPGEWKALTEAEVAHIEEQTASDSLEVLDYRKLWDLPMEYAIGAYYVRFKPAKPKSTTGRDAFATFVAALERNDTGAVVKWCTSSSQRLCILHAEDGVLYMTQVPFEENLRKPGDSENAHKAEQIDAAAVQGFNDLMAALATEGDYDHSRFTDDGTALRTKAVEEFVAKYGDGEQKLDEKKQEQRDEENERKVPDLMAQLQASMAQQKISQGEKA